MKLKNQAIFLILIILFYGCTDPKSTDNEGIVAQEKDGYIKYAAGFNVTTFDNIKLVKITEPFKGATQGLSYWLVPRGIEIPDSLSDELVIRTPIESLVCTSTTHITPLDLLDVSDKLIGFPSTQYISSES